MRWERRGKSRVQRDDDSEPRLVPLILSLSECEQCGSLTGRHARMDELRVGHERAHAVAQSTQQQRILPPPQAARIEGEQKRRGPNKREKESERVVK